MDKYIRNNNQIHKWDLLTDSCNERENKIQNFKFSIGII